MKYSLLISVLFAIVTTLSAMHEVDHIYNQDYVDCVMCTVDHNLVSADAVDSVQDIELYNFGKIVLKNQVQSHFVKKTSNQNRAPPLKIS